MLAVFIHNSGPAAAVAYLNNIDRKIMYCLCIFFVYTLYLQIRVLCAPNAYQKKTAGKSTHD